MLPACRGLDDPGASVGVFFPRHGQSGPHALALLEGRLEVQEGCLLVVHANAVKYLPIWPGGFGLRRAPGALQITDAAGRVVAAEGEMVRLVGGEYPAEFASRVMGREAPSACRGYGSWLVGQVTASAGRSSTP